jgi:hypothetical protein
VKIEGKVASELQEILTRTGYYRGPATATYDAATKQALLDLVNTENLVQRWREDDLLDAVILGFVRERF